MIIPLSAQDVSEGAETQTTTETVDETTLIINTGELPDVADPNVNVSAIGVSDLIRTILVLLLVIGAIYLVLLILKKFSSSGIDGSSLINVVGSKGLMKDSAVHLLEVGNQVFLVGSGNSSVNLISEITDQETIDNIRLNLSKDGPKNNSSFADRIGRILNSGKKMRSEETVRKSETFLRSQRDRLKDL